jgi:hypothetical protein
VNSRIGRLTRCRHLSLFPIFVFAMSAQWFDNGLIVRRLPNEEISAKAAQP